MAIWNCMGRAAAIVATAGMLLAALPGGAEAKTVVIQRTTIYINTLPKGCVKTTYSGGVVVWRCGSMYYQPYDGRYVRVYVR